jgi:hypothetical protein
MDRTRYYPPGPFLYSPNQTKLIRGTHAANVANIWRATHTSLRTPRSSLETERRKDTRVSMVEPAPSTNSSTCQG